MCAIGLSMKQQYCIGPKSVYSVTGYLKLH